MEISADELKFCGLANRLALEEFAASFDDARSLQLQSELYREFIQAGSPSNKKDWLRAKIGELFKAVDKRPQWIESSASWPFWNGRPMVFVTEFAIPSSDISRDMSLNETVIYVFATRTPHPNLMDSFVMEYEVVTQFRSLGKIAAKVKSTKT